jgi:hypothetical protein
MVGSVYPVLILGVIAHPTSENSFSYLHHGNSFPIAAKLGIAEKILAPAYPVNGPREALLSWIPGDIVLKLSTSSLMIPIHQKENQMTVMVPCIAKTLRGRSSLEN